MGIKSKATGNAKVGRMVITGGKNRVLVARKPRAKEWTLERQATFLEELAMTGNVTTSVVVVGMSLGGAYHRRSHDPAFAAAWQAALSRGYALRGGDWGLLDRVLVRVVEPAPGDVLLMAAGPGQVHVGIRTATGFVHADAGLRRVVERPGMPPWPVIGVWRMGV